MESSKHQSQSPDLMKKLRRNSSSDLIMLHNCDRCSNRFFTVSGLRQHEAVIHHKCLDCDQIFRSMFQPFLHRQWLAATRSCDTSQVPRLRSVLQIDVPTVSSPSVACGNTKL